MAWSSVRDFYEGERKRREALARALDDIEATSKDGIRAIDAVRLAAEQARKQKD